MLRLASFWGIDSSVSHVTVAPREQKLAYINPCFNATRQCDSH